MDAVLERRARDAIAAIDVAVGEAEEVSHADIQTATNEVIAFRERAIAAIWDGRA